MEERQKSWRTVVTAGAGMAVGAAVGLLFGLMLLESVFIGPVAGAAVGAVISLL